MSKSYLAATPEAGQAFFQRPTAAPCYMLNLLAFRPTADYSQDPALASAVDLTGAEAYAAYMKAIAPLFAEVGSEIVFFGQAGPFLIGPEAEQWDAVLLIRHASKEAFLQFANSPVYQAHAGHRTAALADSRLLPLSELPPRGWKTLFMP